MIHKNYKKIERYFRNHHIISSQIEYIRIEFFQFFNNDFWNPHSISSENNRIHKNRIFQNFSAIIFEILTSFQHKMIEYIRIELFHNFQQWVLKTSHHFITKLKKYKRITFFSKFFDYDFWSPHIISPQIKYIRIELISIFQQWFLKSSQHFITK